MVSVSRFALLRAFGFDQCVVSSFEFYVASIQSSTKRESAFSMLFALVCCDSCFDFCDVCTFISVPRGTPRAFINMASLYIYLCGDGTTRVLYIYTALFVSSLVIDNNTLLAYISLLSLS